MKYLKKPILLILRFLFALIMIPTMLIFVSYIWYLSFKVVTLGDEEGDILSYKTFFIQAIEFVKNNK